MSSAMALVGAGSGDEVEIMSSMDNFYKRYNKVALDKVALNNEQRRLNEENENLRSILKQYLDGISVNDDVLGRDNPLFVVNEKVNVNLETLNAHAHSQMVDGEVSRPTVVEAATVSRTMNMARSMGVRDR